MTASLIKSSGLFSVFWPILIILLSGWSLLVLLFPNVPVLLPIFWGLFQVPELLLVSLSPSCFIEFFSSLARSRYSLFFSLSFIYTPWSVRTAKSTIRQVLFFCWLSLGLVVWPRLGDPFVSQNPKEFCASHSP